MVIAVLTALVAWDLYNAAPSCERQDIRGGPFNLVHHPVRQTEPSFSTENGE
jgi:hypothetical protein